jgi:hypothetical protein
MIIKIANLGFLFLLASIVLSCDKGEVDRKFSIRLDRNFEVPAGLDYLNAHYFVLDEIPTFYQQVVNQQNVPAGTKITLVPESAVISSIYNDVDFDFVDKVSVRIFTNTNVKDKPEAFYIEYIPTTVDGELRLIPTSFDAQPFLKDGIVNAEVRFFFKRTTPQLMNLRIVMIIPIGYS